jgi:hypothetical protein
MGQSKALSEAPARCDAPRGQERLRWCFPRGDLEGPLATGWEGRKRTRNGEGDGSTARVMPGLVRTISHCKENDRLLGGAHCGGLPSHKPPKNSSRKSPPGYRLSRSFSGGSTNAQYREDIRADDDLSACTMSNHAMRACALKMGKSIPFIRNVEWAPPAGA